jgi:hypothetical protein
MLTNPFHQVDFLSPPTTELSMFLMADNQLQICDGVELSTQKGIITKDLGYTKVGTTLQSSKAITGLHNFRQTSAIQKILATVNNSGDTALTLQYNNGGTWTAINTSTTWTGFEDALTDMEDFIGYCFIVGYDDTDGVFLPNISLTGTTYSTSTNITSMPQAKYIKRYRDRLYAANCYYSATAYPYRVYFSSVPSAGAITWTPASDFIDVDYSEQITGIAENWDQLIIFTEFSAYLYNQDTKKKSWDTGCINHRTIQNVGAYTIWATKTAVWASTSGRPTPISNDITQLLKNSNPTGWRSAVVDREYHLYVGSTMASGIAYGNCVLIFDTELGYWRWRELANALTAMARYTASNKDFLYMGATSGEVFVKSKWTDASPVYADAGYPITAQFRTKAYHFGDPSTQKTITKLLTYTERGNGLMFRFRVFNERQEVMMPFTDIGQLDRFMNVFDKKLTGHFIQFEGRELGSKQSFKFYGFTAILGVDSGKDAATNKDK